MITIEECEKTLAQKGNSYSKQEIERILEFLKKMSNIALKEYQRRNGKSNSLHKGQH
jgi:hypothetical protein